MKVVAYPADRYGCGHHRVIWPCEELARAGHDVTVVPAGERYLGMVVNNRTDEIVEIKLPDEVDVVILQRVTHKYLAQAVSVLRRQGVAVVVDVDDDLAAVHPSNPAWLDLHPNRSKMVYSAKPHMHSWHNLTDACQNATLVTTTTPALARRYAVHGRVVVIPNYLARHYYDVPHEDSDLLGWPASLHSHPDDPAVIGNAIQRLVHEGARFRVTSPSRGVGQAFGFASDDEVELVHEHIELPDWPNALTQLGVGVAPLADTRFNAAKSWLKPLELSALGVPWVASPRAEYERLHKLGCGVLVDKPKAWYAVLRRLLSDSARRVELSEAGRAVAGELSLTRHAWRWWEAWELALNLQRGSARVASVVG